MVRAETLHVRPAGRETRVATRTKDIQSQRKLSPMFGSRFPEWERSRAYDTVRPDVEAQTVQSLGDDTHEVVTRPKGA